MRSHAPAKLLPLLLLVLVSILPWLGATTGALDASCAPAACGSLAIRYPFWLRGTHAPECGYPTFGVTCDDPTGATPPSLNESYLRVLDIRYAARSVVAFHANLADGNACLPTRFNVSATFALSLLAVSGANSQLFFSSADGGGNCSRPPGALERNCSGSSNASWFVYTGRTDGGRADSMPVPGCRFSVVPVMPGSELRNWEDYKAMVRRGFLLDWTVPGDCAACNASGGGCRYEAGANAFGCLCPNDGRMHPETCGEFVRHLLVYSFAC